MIGSEYAGLDDPFLTNLCIFLKIYYIIFVGLIIAYGLTFILRM